MASSNENLLLEIRQNFDYAQAYWAPVRNEGAIDVQYAVRGPWSDAERKARDGRPTLALDEMGQYLNQLENQARQNKRAVKVNPQGDGATDATAKMRGGIIRGSEYQSKAQHAYITAFGDSVRRSYGMFKLTTDFAPKSFNRVLKVVRIPNPDVIYLDPDFKEADASDCGWSFEIDRLRENKFLKRWPKAEVRSFSPEQILEAPGWIIPGDDGKYVQVASYCKLEQGKKTLVLLEDGSTLDLSKVKGAKLVKANSMEMVVLEDGRQFRALDSREDNDPSVVQYMTNGVEILEKNPLDFKEIPIIPVFAREVWVSDGGVSKREFHSPVRMARDAYKLYCYARSAQCERAGMDPLTPYEGYEGQFDTNTNFETLNRTRVGYVEFAATSEATGAAILPLPKRDWQEPPLQQLEILAEGARRAIQASMGGSPLPTAAQRQNEKSGVALAKIEQSSDEGNFHMLDNFGRALERAGRMMDAVLDVTYDTPNRQVPYNDNAGEHKIVTINPHDAQGNKMEGFHVGTGDHGVTISTGPSSQSQREEAQDFTETLVQNPELMGANAPKILALLVKLRDLGPIGDKIAEILDPADGQPQIPPQLQAQIHEGQALIQQLTAEVQSLKSGDDTKRYICDETQKTARVIGLIKIDQQDAETRLDAMLGTIADRFQQLHEKHLKLMDQQHATDLQDSAQAHQAAQATQTQNATEEAAQNARDQAPEPAAA